MHLYWELAKLSIQRQITYRAATLAGLATNVFFGLLRAFIMVALYGTRNEFAGISLQGAITYTGLTQAVIAYLSLFSWFEIVHSVNSGQIGSDLLKPMNFFGFWLAQDLGRAMVNLATRGLTIMLIYALVFDITAPQRLSQWLALFVAIALAWLVSFSWRFLVNLAAFWTPNAVGFGRFFFAVSWFTSGFLMPLRFFPDWFVRLCYLTPFPHMINTVVEVYLGVLSGSEVLYALLLQALWALGLMGLGQIVMRAGIRRLVIQGG